MPGFDNFIKPTKMSKKNTTPEMEERDRAAAERLKNRKSEHFAVGTFIIRAGKGRGEILSHAYCKCRIGETRTRVRWEDGTEESIRIIGLNRNGTHHGD